MKSFSISNALGVGWQSFKRRPWYLLGLALAVFALFALSIGNAVVTALAYILYSGYIAVLIRHYRGETIVFDDLFTLDNRWISFAFMGLIKGILIFLGFVCFILPGIYLAVRWMFAEFYVINEGMRPMEALRASSALTKGHWWHLFGFSLVVILLLILGLFALIVGVIVVSVVVFIATFKIYEDLKAAPASQSSEMLMQ
jgi:hypothetical protein